MTKVGRLIMNITNKFISSLYAGIIVYVDTSMWAAPSLLLPLISFLRSSGQDSQHALLVLLCICLQSFLLHAFCAQETLKTISVRLKEDT